MANTIIYTLHGDYLLPDLKLPEQPKVEIGVFGQRHKRYLKEHHRLIYFNLLTSCKLAAYLADIDSQANEMYDLLVRQLSEKKNISEQLKAEMDAQNERNPSHSHRNRQPRDNLHLKHNAACNDILS